MNETLLQFKGIIDEEILAYEALGELYEIKQSILVQGKSDALWDIDAQIVERAESIRELNKKRREVAKYLGNEDITMSEIIEKAKNSNDVLVDSLQVQQNKLGLLAKTLSLQEKTNMTLIKNGLTMVGKTFDIIVGVLSPQSKGQYDKNGHDVGTDKSLVSSVIEEA